MIAFILKLLAGPLGSLIKYAAVIVTLIGVVFGWLAIHDANVRNEALLKFNQSQLEQVIKDNKKIAGQLEEIKKNSDQILQETDAANALAESDAKSVKDFLNSPEAKAADKPVSDLLKETIRRIK